MGECMNEVREYKKLWTCKGMEREELLIIYTLLIQAHIAGGSLISIYSKNIFITLAVG